MSKDDKVREQCKRAMREACIEEQTLIRQMLPVVSRDSSIAFESSNQYFYLTADLVEAYVSICYAMRQIDNEM